MSEKQDGVKRWEVLCGHAAALGFDSILTPPLWSSSLGVHCRAVDNPDHAHPQWFDNISMNEVLGALSGICRRHGLSLLTDLVLDAALAPATLIDQWGARLRAWTMAGVHGFRCLAVTGLAADDWRKLIKHARASRPECHFMAWTPGLTPAQVGSLAGVGFDATFSSLPWWDYRASWLVEEHDRLDALAPVITPLADPGDSPPDPDSGADRVKAMSMRAMLAGEFSGDGILMPMGFEDRVGTQAVCQMNQRISCSGETAGRLALLSGPMAGVTTLLRGGRRARLLLINPDSRASVSVNWQSIRSSLPGSYIISGASEQALPAVVQASECVSLFAAPAAMVKPTQSAARAKPQGMAAALRAPRIAIENVAPAVDNGLFPVKRTIGESLDVQADIFMDGHDCIAAALLWRAADEAQWRNTTMHAIGNDRWQASFLPDRLGRYYYTIQAWRDDWGSYCEHLRKKVTAKQNVSVEVEEGRRMLTAALAHAAGKTSPLVQILENALLGVGQAMMGTTQNRPRRFSKASGARASNMTALPIPQADPAQVQALFCETLAQAMSELGGHPFEVYLDCEYPLVVERREVCFASWYELFPRSQSPVPGSHGTFPDVIGRLPAIRDMGFDVVYLPPIHPIGSTHRKGRNNSVEAGPDDPGSPYAIGSADGGHEAVHPQLGSMDDFRRLIRSAHGYGLEIAMDFAVQCSPDHPWLTEHPQWFDWRADGSLRYAENPPKRYEDIVNPNFYGHGATAGGREDLWQQLRDVVLFWIDRGVRIFRVDNPHTKPLPFWQWMIAQVQDLHPDTIFLAEAFTRPKLMYRLAKLGFSQSYTYFIWRNGKQEIIDYLTELNTTPVADFFRPNFFVNTPDINPYFLQTSGRPGFLIRAALAATTSGLWGIYNGFELCEARNLPGKEEYQDSEKYELRSWDWDRPGNIVAEIRRLNQIRRTNRALQSHLGIRFHHVDNDQILFFSKSTREGDNVVLVAISLDPHNTQTGTLELPLWQWGLADNASVFMRNLFENHRFTLNGKHHRVELAPQQPFLLWQIEKLGLRVE